MGSQTIVSAIDHRNPFRKPARRIINSIDQMLTPKRIVAMIVILGFAYVLLLVAYLLPRSSANTTKHTVSSETESKLEIPELGIEVGLQRKEAGITAQDIVDSDDYAVLLSWPEQSAIVDHSTQSFQNLITVTPGKSVAYVTENGKMKAYVCVAVHIGKIMDGNEESCDRIIVDSTGQDVRYANQGGLCLYSCLGQTEDGVTPITLTYWQPAESCEVLVADVQNLLSGQ